MSNVAAEIKKLEAKMYWVEEKGGCCAFCGYDLNLAALEFHHTDPGMKTKSHLVDKDEEELDSCVLVCRICHSRIHATGYGNKHIIENYRRLLDIVSWYCGNCGRVLDAEERDFDLHHPPGVEKTGGPSQLIYNYEENKEELEQLIPLCKNCHREEHYPHLFVGGAVNTYLRDLKVKLGKPKGTKFTREKKKFQRMIKDGYQKEEIVRELGISLSSFYSWRMKIEDSYAIPYLVSRD